MVPQEERPLAGPGDVRCLAQDLRDRVAVLLPQRHEHPRHEREVEGHVALVAVPEVRPDVGRPLVGLGQQQAAGVAAVELGPDAAQDVVRLRQVLADRAFALDQVRNGVEPQPVDARVEPEFHYPQHRLHHLRVVEVQVGLMMEEPVPEIRLRLVVPGPVRLLGVGEDDAHPGVPALRVAPDVEVALRRAPRRATRRLEPGMLVGGVIDDQLGDDPDPALVRLAQERAEVAQRAVARVDPLVVRDVVPVVTQRRRVEGQQPEAGDAEPLEVVELLREPGEVADAVRGRVAEGPHVRLVDDRVFVPERVAVGFVAHRRKFRSARLQTCASPSALTSART